MQESRQIPWVVFSSPVTPYDPDSEHPRTASVISDAGNPYLLFTRRASGRGDIWFHYILHKQAHALRRAQPVVSEYLTDIGHRLDACFRSTSLSGILCVGHNMRSVDAPKTENVPV